MITSAETSFEDALRIGFARICMPETNHTLNGYAFLWYTADESVEDVDFRFHHTQSSRLSVRFAAEVEDLTGLRKKLAGG